MIRRFSFSPDGAAARDPDRKLEVAPQALRRLRDDWDRWRAGAELPPRQRIDPTELAYCLPNLALVDIEREPFRPRYRLVGTRLVDLWGRELRGRYVDEVYRPRVAAEALAGYRQVVFGRQPLYSERIFTLPLLRLGYYRLMLPFAPEGGEVDLVMLAIYPNDRRIRRAEDWQDLARE